MNQFKKSLSFALILVTWFLQIQPVLAKTPFAIQQAVVWVHCGNRQGSGVVINGEEGYVLTNAHVLLNLDTMEPDDCEVGFITSSSNPKPDIFYWADWKTYVFDDNENRDFAILQITDAQQARYISPFPFIKTDEFSHVDDPISIIGFPGKNHGLQQETSGSIIGLEQGIVKTDAEITPGVSGGAGINGENNLTGIATRILLQQTNGVEEIIDYELVDIRAILTWLDTFGVNVHDNYIVHANPDQYHLPEALFTPNSLNCSLLGRSIHDPAVYCLREDGTRSIFPNKNIYFSWFADFSGVETLSDIELAQFQLTSNITMKPGSLIKIQSDPRVYIVSDIDGKLRWIRNEQVAVDLYGESWAGFVTDIPVTFFTNYHLGPPVD
ncbi:MAG: serine protease [bacterium]|nr:serine protease [bacterium]